ncbi:zinc finger protein [Trypanosoma melophagium]|uniref:zinc finger protein n=1 Tax=Trypanosoma melophagium TaxID=715481 RepID=UPI00351A7DC8|nr:zinc finger protein [Trypanosoma melophagium]
MSSLFTVLDLSLSTSRINRRGDHFSLGAPTTTMVMTANSSTEPHQTECSAAGVLSQPSLCTNCGEEGIDLCFCPCYQVQYCSTECQSAHWAVHKPDCGYGRKKPQLVLLSCTYCYQKSYTLRRCPCGYALYCDRKCQIDDWPHHEGICTRSGILKTNSFLRRSKRVDAGVQTQCDASPGASTTANVTIAMRNIFTSRVSGNRSSRFPERLTDGEETHHGESSTTATNGNGVNTSCMFQSNRSNEMMRAPLKNMREATTNPLYRAVLQDSGFIDFDRVDFESESSSEHEGSGSNAASLRVKEDYTHKRSSGGAGGDVHRPTSSLNIPPNGSHYSPQESSPMLENPLIAVPIRTTFDTLPGLASYLAGQNKDNGTIVILASFANSIAEEMAARREISQASKRELAEMMRRFVLGRVRIALSEMNAEEEKDRKDILTDAILWRRKVAYPAYKDIRKLLLKLYYRQ